MNLQAGPVKGEYFVALFDITNFSAFYKKNPSETVFELLNEFSGICLSVIESHGGKVVKFSNDSGLAVFPIEITDSGVRAMIELKDKVDLWLKSQVPGSQLAMNAHVGDATIGKLKNGSFEIVGEAVSMVYSMGKRQFLLSPETFRKLVPETRQAFKKFTPPIVYRLA